MAQKAIEQRWDAELERRGLPRVVAFLSVPEFVGQGPGADYPLHVSGLPNPTRGYVESWAARKEAETATLAERRHRETLETSRQGVRWAFWAFVVGSAAAALSLISLFK